MAQTIQKVTGFITRGRSDGGHDLLVFQHPSAGVQLPAGTVEEGEGVSGTSRLRRRRCLVEGLPCVRMGWSHH